MHAYHNRHGVALESHLVGTTNDYREQTADHNRPRVTTQPLLRSSSSQRTHRNNEPEDTLARDAGTRLDVGR